MSGLVEAITVEISDREQRRASLTSEIDQIDRQLEQLHGMHQAATILAGEGTVEEPKPAEPSRTSAKPGGRPLSPGRNGGKAPGQRRKPAVTGKRQPGSAPSGTPAPARTSSSQNGEGGSSKRAVVLAFIQGADWPVRRADIAAALNMTGSAVGQHIAALIKDGAIQARGATTSRVYVTTDRADRATATSGHAKTTGTTASLPNLKARVIEAITADQGALTEERLALALDIDREDVAVACGELLDAGRIELEADATYITGRGGGWQACDPHRHGRPDPHRTDQLRQRLDRQRGRLPGQQGRPRRDQDRRRAGRTERPARRRQGHEVSRGRRLEHDMAGR